MLRLELLREGDRVRVELAFLGVAELAADRRGDLLERGRADLVLDAAGCARLPVEAERVVDGDQHVADAAGAGDHDHPSYMRGALDDPLPHADELGLAAGVDRVVARAVLAGHLASAGIHAERPQRAFQKARDLAKSLVGPRPRVLLRAGPGERDRLVVE